MNVVYAVYWLFVYIKNIRVRAFFRTVGQKHFNLAFEIDVFGNYAFAPLWNWLFIKKFGYKFGRKGETISSALGRNQLSKTLSIIGWIMVLVLWIVDLKYWFKGGHCINSIMLESDIIRWSKS